MTKGVVSLQPTLVVSIVDGRVVIAVGTEPSEAVNVSALVLAEAADEEEANKMPKRKIGRRIPIILNDEGHSECSGGYIP